MSAELFDNDFFLIFFFFFPVGYWAGLRFADITSPDGAQSIVKLIALDVHGDEKPSFLMTTLFELVFSLVVGPVFILGAMLYGGFIMLILTLVFELTPVPSWIYRLIDENFLMAWAIAALAIVMAYLGKIARKSRSPKIT